MFSNKNTHSKPVETESWPFNSPQHYQGRSRRLPYKLLSFPSSKCSLWDHTTVGDSKLVHLFYQRHPRINIEKSVLRSGHIFISPESKTSNVMSCTLCGRLLLTENENQAVIIFTKLKFNEEIMQMQTQQQNPAEYLVPATFSNITNSKNGVVNFYQGFKDQAVLWLQNSIRKKDAVVINNFIKCKVLCQFENHSSSITCNIQFCLATLDATFLLKPILPLTIILTALSRGLSNPAGNAFLHGEPKSGYVTMDETRRVLLVLDSDPKVTSLPIIGIWIGGVETVQHPFVWASCIRYLNLGYFGKQVCVPPDPFLVLIYEKATFSPQFYDCTLEPCSSKDGFAIYSGGYHTVLDQADVTKPRDVTEIPQLNNGQLSFTLDLMDDSVLASQKTVITPCLENITKNSPFEDGSSPYKIASPSSGKSAAFSKDPCCKCSCKSNESYGASSDSVMSATKTPSKMADTPRQERQSMESPLEDSAIPNQNLYGLLMAQEQQLKQLKEQLDSLLHEKEAATLSVGCSSMDDNRPVAGKTNPPIKAVNSAGTMTSLAWPPLPLVNDCPQAQNETNSGDNRCITQLPSPEIVRKQALDSEFQSSFLNNMADSLANLQLPNFEESMESRQSSIVVDLHDYPESHSSSSKHSVSNVGDLAQCNDLTAENNILDMSQSQMLGNTNQTEDDSTFYGNLLKKIQTILSHQESSDGIAGDNKILDSTESSSVQPILHNERSSFDSLLIPHLNYVSMLPTDITSDQSIAFCSLALKYLNKCSTKFPHPSPGRVFDRNNMTSLITLYKATESNLSFASKQYLEKHGLSSTAYERQNHSKTE